MERLTKRDPKNNEPSYIYRTDCGDANVEATEYDAIWKLAAYEDTGLTPEQISALQAENERLRAEVEISKVAQMNLDIDIVSTYDALRDEIDRWKARAEALERRPRAYINGARGIIFRQTSNHQSAGKRRRG